mgnify:CR=1 FL=1|jgi:hypothetical protein
MIVKLIIRNVVRDAATRDLRRANIGKIQVSPKIGGQHLPPRRSRKVESDALTTEDLDLICEMMRVGVLRVFHPRPFREVSVDAFAVVMGHQILPESLPGEPEAAAPPSDPVPVKEAPREVIEPIPVPEVPDAEVVEEPAPEVAPSEEPAAEEAPPEEPEVTFTRVELKGMKNSDLRDILAGLPGHASGAGLRKIELVEAILQATA